MHEVPNMRNEQGGCDELSDGAEGQGKAKLVGEADGVRAKLFKGVVVLEGAEAAGDHAVAKEMGRVEGFDEALVKLRQPELPALPEDGVTVRHESRDSAAYRTHAELLLHDSEAGGELEAALDGGVNDDFVAKGEAVRHGLCDENSGMRWGARGMDWDWAHRWSFAAAIGIASRATSLYERLKPTPVRETRMLTAEMRLSRHGIVSGASRLDAVYAEPVDADGSAARPRAVLLICHGIGEIVDWWLPVQRLLAARGCASLVFNYTGYGKSTGKISARQFEDDAVVAFAYLERLAPGQRIAVLGFSLGTGVAAAAIQRMNASRLVLCAGFPSFQEAACCVCVPARLKRLAPPIWRAEESLLGCRIPVLVVHGEEDGLFPVALGRALYEACGPDAEWMLVPGYGHNQPFNQPRLDYWEPILRWIDRGSISPDHETAVTRTIHWE
jgi:uncharacterized protein